MIVIYVQGAFSLVANGLVIFVTWRNTRWAALQLQDSLTFSSSFSRVMLYHGESIVPQCWSCHIPHSKFFLGSVYFLFVRGSLCHHGCPLTQASQCDHRHDRGADHILRIQCMSVTTPSCVPTNLSILSAGFHIPDVGLSRCLFGPVCKISSVASVPLRFRKQSC